MPSNTPRGRFITLEGIEGVGKSTHLKLMAEYLKQKQLSVTVTREPGGTPLAEAIRKLVLTRETAHEVMTHDAELLLFFAARAQHIRTVIEPALAKGDWVLCDRFIETSYAYQGGGRGIPFAFIQDLQKWIQKNLKIDCVLLLDAPVELALKRLLQRKCIDRIESETVNFFNRVHDAYHARAKQPQNHYHVIDASVSIEEVQKKIQHVLDRFLQYV